jgi:hypothetical protein
MSRQFGNVESHTILNIPNFISQFIPPPPPISVVSVPHIPSCYQQATPSNTGDENVHVIHVDRVRLYLRTAATNGPIDPLNQETSTFSEQGQHWPIHIVSRADAIYRLYFM